MTGREATLKPVKNEDMEDFLPTVGKGHPDIVSGGSEAKKGTSGHQRGTPQNPFTVNYQTLLSYTAGLEDIILDRIFERKPELTKEFSRRMEAGDDRLLIFKTLIRDL